MPRGRTALLVEAAAAVTGPAPAVVDLCCGSGATTVALAHRLTPRWLAAADIDPAAVACARRNLAGLAAEVFEGDLFAPLPPHWRGRLDLVVFTAGVGENNARLRVAVLADLPVLGIVVDPVRNDSSSREARVISSDDSDVTVMVVPTNEELAIARQALDLLADR